MKGDVFVCYARKDQDFVLQLAANLKRYGVPIWIDQWDIPPGAPWDRCIDDALDECGHFLIVLSPEAVNSPEVQSELRTALDEKKHIVPVIHSACRVPRRLRTIQHVEFSSCGPHDGVALKRLLDTLQVTNHSSVPKETGSIGSNDHTPRAGHVLLKSETNERFKPSILVQEGVSEMRVFGTWPIRLVAFLNAHPGLSALVVVALFGLGFLSTGLSDKTAPVSNTEIENKREKPATVSAPNAPVVETARSHTLSGPKTVGDNGSTIKAVKPEQVENIRRREPLKSRTEKTITQQPEAIGPVVPKAQEQAPEREEIPQPATHSEGGSWGHSNVRK